MYHYNDSGYNADPTQDSSSTTPQPVYQSVVAQPDEHNAVAQPEYHDTFSQPSYQGDVHQPDYHHAPPQQIHYTVNNMNFFVSPSPQMQGYRPQPPASKSNPESEEDDSEVGEEQYLPLPQPRLFLSVEEYDLQDEDPYTEIQIGLGPNLQMSPKPACDNCQSKHRQRIVYICPNCNTIPNRPLCKKCARKELLQASSFHKPDHEVRKWQPIWRFDLRDGLNIPMLSPGMEELARDIPDDVRTLKFESRMDFNDKAIRLFLPSPGGSCRVEVQIQFKSVSNERVRRGILDTIKKSSSEVAGTVRVSAYPFILSTPPIPPKKNLPRRKRPNLSDSIDITRDADLTKLHSLVVYVTTDWSPDRGIELVIQDEDLESKKFVDNPFEWKLRTISMTHIPKSVNFASLAQQKQHELRTSAMEKKVQAQRKEQLRKEHAETTKAIRERRDATMKEAMEGKELSDPLAQIFAGYTLSEHQRGRQAQRPGHLRVTPDPHLRSSSMPSNPTSTTKPAGRPTSAARPPVHPHGPYGNPRQNMNGRFADAHLHPMDAGREPRKEKRSQSDAGTSAHSQPPRTTHSASPNQKSKRKPASPYKAPVISTGSKYRRRRK